MELLFFFSCQIYFQPSVILHFFPRHLVNKTVSAHVFVFQFQIQIDEDQDRMLEAQTLLCKYLDTSFQFIFAKKESKPFYSLCPSIRLNSKAIKKNTQVMQCFAKKAYMRHKKMGRCIVEMQWSQTTQVHKYLTE